MRLESSSIAHAEEVPTAPYPLALSNQTSALWPLAVVILFACIVSWPCLFWGLQFGHDHNLHITYLHFFNAQLRAGELYPRWISGLNFGAGSPIFFVQYPLPFFAAAGLQWIFRIPATPVGEAHALGLFVFVASLVSGVSSWLWCRALTNPIAAMLASVAYLTMPYVYGCDVYFRAAIGEYSALAWVPLALFFAHAIDVRPRRSVAGLAFAFAAVILSNLFTAILFAPFLFSYALCRVPRSRILVAGLRVAAALILGLGISSVYFLPMNASRAFFNLANLLKLGPDIFFYRDQLFPFGKTLFPSASLALRLVDLLSGALGLVIIAISLVRLRQPRTSGVLLYAGIICVLSTCVAPLLHLVGLFPHPELANLRVIDVRSRIFLITFLTLEAALLAYASVRETVERLPKFLMGGSLVCFFLSTRWSEWIWRHAAFLWNVQFPWRLSGLLSVFSLGLFAFALRDFWQTPSGRNKMLLVCAGLWFAIGVSSYVALDIRGYIAQPFVTEIKRRVESPYPVYASISQLPTPDELGPNDGLAEKVLLLAGKGTAKLDSVTARHLRLTADCSGGCTLLLKLVYYPLWRAHDASNQLIPLRASSRAGLTELSLGPGAHQVDLELPFGRSEIWGAWLSSISFLVVTLLLLWTTKQNRSEHQADRAASVNVR